MVSDGMGKAAQMILGAVVDGETDAVRFADVAAGRVRASRETLERAFTGKATAHHRFLLGEHLRPIEHLDEALRRISEAMTRRLTPPEPPTPPHEEQAPPPSPHATEPGSSPSVAGSPALLNWQQAGETIDHIPGIRQRIAEGLLAEIGITREPFPSAKHLASWGGRCPGKQERAGKRLCGKTRKGHPSARQLLMHAAHAASQRKNISLSPQDRRMAARRGSKKAAVAVGHRILVRISPLLSDGGTSQDVGGNAFDERDRPVVQKQLVRRLERMGSHVELQQMAQAGSSPV